MITNPNNKNIKNVKSGIPPEGQEWLQLGLDTATVGIWDWDGAAEHIFWDARMHKLFGIPNGSFDGKFETFLSMIHEDDRMMVKETFLASWGGGEIDLEFKLIWPDGSLHIIKDQGGPIYRGKKTIKLMGACTDITDIEKHKNADQDTKFFLAAIVESSEDSIVSIDFNRVITSWNKGAEHLYGYSAAEVIGKPVTMLTLPEDLKELMSNINRIRHGKIVERFQTIRVGKEGQLIDLEIELSPVKNDNDEVIGVSTFARDITERKHQEANLAFLAGMNLDFAPLLSMREVMEQVGERLADFLQLSRCHFSIIDEENDRVEVIYEYRRDKALPGILGVHRISDNFTERGRKHLRVGKIAVIDAASDSPLVKTNAPILQQSGIGSVIDVPYVEARLWKFLLTLGRTEAGWQDHEVELLKELAPKVFIRIERARTEEALRKSEEKYHNLLMESLFAVAILKGKDMVVSLANDAIKNLWGKGNDIEGKPLVSLMPEIKEQGFAALLDKVYTTGEPFYGHEVLVKLQRNGIWEDVYFNFIYQPYKEADETISGVTIIANEVTTQAIANKKIAASEQNVSRLFMEAPAIICVLRGPQHVYELANEMYMQLIGKRDILGEPIRKLFPELEGQGYFELLDNVYATGEPFIGKEMLVKFDKGAEKLKEVYFNLVYQPLHNREGEIDGIMVHGVDVTEQVLARRKLQESETRLMQMVEERTEKLRERERFLEHVAVASPDVIYIMKLDNKEITYSNKCLAGTIGYTPEQIHKMKSPFFDIMHPEDLPLMMKHVENFKSAAPGEVREIEYRLVDAKSNIRWFIDRNAVFATDETGTPVEKIGISNEITIRKHNEEHLQNSLTLLRNAERVAGMGSWNYVIPTGKMNWSNELYRLMDMEQGTPVTPDIYLDLVIEEDIVLAKRLIRKIVQDFKSFEEVIRIKTPAGEDKIIKVKAVVIKNEKEAPIGVVGIDHDITDQKEAAGKITDRNKELRRLNDELIHEEKERQSVEKLLEDEKQITAEVIEGIPNGIIMFDQNLNIKNMNGAAARLLTVSGEDTRSLFIILKEFIDHENGLLLHKVLKGEGSSLQKVKAANSDKYFNINITPVKSGKKVQGGMLFIEDVTESVKCTQLLEEKNKQLQTVINNMNKQ